MSDLLMHSMFQEVLFPLVDKGEDESHRELQLRRLKRFVPELTTHIHKAPLIVFDLETTGLDYKADRIIEIGAIKLEGLEPVAEFSTLVHTDMELTPDIVRLTGISQSMLEGQPKIEQALIDFLEFIQGGILVAHNADFDLNMIHAAYSRIGIDLDWACFCTLKMAREVLADLDNKKLDTLAVHYGLTFESRHRSIGDVKVTCGVLKHMLSREARRFRLWSEFHPFSTEVKNTK